MSDLLKEIYIKQAQRENAATTESEKIASLNAAYAQAQKVKKQREIDALHKKSADLKAKSIDQRVAADKAEQTAKEKISREQQLQKFNYDFYLSGLKKGIYDPKAANALGVSEKVYKGVLAKIQADLAPKPTKRYTYTPKIDGQIEGEPKESPQQSTYAEQQAAKRRAMNDDVSGTGQRGVSKQKNEVSNNEVSNIEIKTGLDTQSANAVYQASKLAEKYNVTADRAAGVVLKLMGVAVMKEGAENEKKSGVKTIKTLSNGMQYEDLSETNYRAVQDPKEYLGILVNNTVKKAESGKSTKLGLADLIFLEVYSDSKKISKEDKKNISILRSTDTLSRLKEYTDYLDKLSVADLQKEIETPTVKIQMSSAIKKSLAQSRLNENQMEISQNAVKELLASDAEYNVENAAKTLEIIDEEIDELEMITPTYDELKAGVDHEVRMGRKTEAEAQEFIIERLQEEYGIVKKYGLTSPAEVYQLLLKRREQKDVLHSLKTTAYVGDYESAIMADEKQVKKWIEQGKKKAGNLTVGYQVNEKGKSFLTMTNGEGVIGTGLRALKNAGLYALVLALGGGSVIPGISQLQYNFIARKVNADLDDNFASYSFKLDDLTEQEKEVLFYYLGRYGEDEQKGHNNEAKSAFAYLASIAADVMMRKARESVSDSAFYETIKRLPDGVVENINSFALNIAKNISGMQSEYVAPSSYRWQAAKEKHNMDKWYETMVGDALYAAGNQIPRTAITAAINYVAPGAGTVANTALFATQTAMQDLNDKIAAGWDTADALGYTVLNTAFQTVSEKMFNAFGVDEQMGFVTKAFKKQIEKVAKEKGGKLILEVFSNISQEGFEELLQNAGEQVLNGAFDAHGNLIKDFDFEGMFYDGLIGALVGATGASPQVAVAAVDAVKGKAQQKTQTKLLRTSSEKLKSEIVSHSKEKKMAEQAYDVVYQAAQAGLTLSEARQLVGQINRMAKELGKGAVLGGRDINRAYAMGKINFKTMLAGDATVAYEKVGTNVKAQSDWISLYNAGYSGQEVADFDEFELSSPQAKAAYEFGKAAQAVTDDAQDIDNAAATQEKSEQENLQDAFVSASDTVEGEELARLLTIAGRNGLEIEEVYDGEITDTMRAIYNEGKRGDGNIGTTTVTVNKGSGTLRDKTGGRYNPQLNIEQLRRFAKVTGIDVEIAPDGSVDGKAAFEVGAFKILVSESATMGDFMHEVLESMAALSAEDFGHVSKMMVRHYLDHNHTLEELDNEIVQRMVDYNTKSYPFARKEWVCTYAGELLADEKGMEALFDWLDKHDKSGKAKKSFVEFIKALWEKFKAMCNGDWVGTAEKRHVQKLSAELQGIIDGLENTRTKLASLENGQTVTVGGGESEVRYKNGKSDFEFSIYDDPLYPKTEKERSVFNRSMANKTSYLQEGETDDIIIFTADHCYLVYATGYLQGTIREVKDILGNEKNISMIRKEINNGTYRNSKRTNSVFEIIRSNGRRDHRNIAIFRRGETAETTVELDGEESERDDVGDNSSGIGYLEKLSYSREQDNKYNDAVSLYYSNLVNGDQQKADEAYQELNDLVRRTAAAAGYTELWYHGTNEDWNEYDLAKNNPTHQEYDDGIYLTKSIDEAMKHGKIVKRFYVRPGLSEKAAQRTGSMPEHHRERGKRNFDEILVVYDPSQIKSAEPIVYDDSGYTIPLSERFDSKNKDIRYSLDSTATAEEIEAVKRTLPSADASAIGVMTAEMDELARNSGRIPQGERVKRDIAVPRKVNGEKTMRWARTFFESGVGTPEMVDPVAEDLLNEALSYKAVSNESAFNVAEGMLERKGYEGAIAYFEAAVDDGRFSKDIAALGQLLLNTAAEMKDSHNVKKLVVLISEMGTAAGQTVQALSMLKRMDGEAKLFAVQRAVNKINRELASGKYGKRNDDIKVVLGGSAKGGRVIEVDPVLIQRLLEAGEDAELSSAVTTEIYKDVARQLPLGSFEDGWNAWRYFAMLSAPTTHIRNVTGNAAFMPMVVMKNSLKRIGELLLTQEGDERTAKILPASKKARDYARADALKMETILKSGGKYNEEDVIEQVRKKLPGFLDKLAKLNGAALEWEDWRFLKYHYVSTMSKYLDVNHINPDNITNEQLTRARNYAIQEAMKATYRDGSQLADALNKFSKSSGLAGKVLEGVLPFKKTPINVLKRGIEYSPLGLIRAMTWGAYNLYNQNITINEWLDGFCAGLSGSLIVALGAFAFSLGLVQGGFGMDDDDPEDKAQDNLKRLSGIQEYSIRIGEYSYTLDWAAPAAIPFFMGVELAEAFAEEDGNLFNRVTDAIIDGTDVIVRTSMLDGLQGTIDAIKYESGAAGAILANSLVNYASQAFPAVLGKQANMMDGTRRANFVDPDSVMPNYLQRIGNKLIAKVPILSKKRNAYIDEFGREKTENNWALRFFQNFISPGYYSKIEYGALEEMMSEIYANATEPKTIPVTSSKSFVLNGKRVYLNAKEYEQFARERGQIAHKIMTEMIASDNFDKLSYDEMQELLKKAYEYSGAVAKQSASDYELEGWQLQAEKLEKKGVAISDFILYKHLITDKEKEESIEVLQKAGMSYAQARRHISSINTSFMKDYEKDGISVDITVDAAIAMEKGDYSNYQSAVERIVSMGYSEQDAIEAIHSEAGISGDYVKGSIYTSGDLYNAILTSSDSYKSIYDELVRANINNGKKVGAAKSSVKSGITRRFKTAYENADGAGRAEIKQQMLRCGLYTQSGEVQQRIYTWSKLNK